MIQNYLRPKKNFRVHLSERHDGRAGHLGYMLMALTAVVVIEKTQSEKKKKESPQQDHRKISEPEVSKAYETMIRGLALL